MSTKDFTANVISATKVVPDGNFKDSKASGIWDINEALDLIKGGNWPNAANLNPAAFVDGLFQTHLYTGTASAQTITNNIDLTKGGLVWMKSRTGTDEHTLMDTETGTGSYLISHSANQAASTSNAYITSYNSNGFSIGSGNQINRSSSDFVSWTFRKQPKFFDIVTYTGDNSTQTVNHNLGSVPGMIIVKRLNDAGNWGVKHRSIDATDGVFLNLNHQRYDNATYWGDTEPTSTQFTVGTTHSVDSAPYVAYLFAHNDDDGGFGEPGDQDIIKCGSYTGNGSDQFIDLGFEPQWVMIKCATSGGTYFDWVIFDNMRKLDVSGSGNAPLMPNLSDSEGGVYASSSYNLVQPTPTGMIVEGTSGPAAVGQNGDTYIYMAIRRGGMQTPTAASQVFAIATKSANEPAYVSNFTVDMALRANAINSTHDTSVATRLTGKYFGLSNSTYQFQDGNEYEWDYMDGWNSNASNDTNSYSWMWKRARGFFDVVAYTGTGSARTVAHNLDVAPEMMWVKNRDNADEWAIYYGDNTDYLNLNDNGATADSDSRWNDTSPTSSVFTVGTDHSVNASGENYISYHFATVAGVSKIGSVSHSGSSTDVDCGFTSGASLVILKRTDDTGSWLLFDSVRGIIAGNSPYLKLQATAAEVTSVNILNPLSSGFQIPDDQTDGDYIFYAIAAI